MDITRYFNKELEPTTSEIIRQVRLDAVTKPMLAQYTEELASLIIREGMISTAATNFIEN